MFEACRKNADIMQLECSQHAVSMRSELRSTRLYLSGSRRVGKPSVSGGNFRTFFKKNDKNKVEGYSHANKTTFYEIPGVFHRNKWRYPYFKLVDVHLTNQNDIVEMIKVIKMAFLYFESGRRL